MISVRGLFSKTCGHCGGASGHPPIPDDGYLICYPCLLRAAREAQDARIVERARLEWEEEQTLDRVAQRLAEMVPAPKPIGLWMHDTYHVAWGKVIGCSYCEGWQEAAA